jgi:putative PIN family toxin of toxin-antitoxin system
VTKLVLDTNVVIDWLVFDDPFMNPLRERVRARQLTVLTHQPALDELRRVLTYRELKLNELRQQELFGQYAASTSLWPAQGAPSVDVMSLPPGFPRCRDPDDNHFLALAHHAQADALVSRDNAVLKLRKRTGRFGFEILDVPQMIARVGIRPV